MVSAFAASQHRSSERARHMIERLELAIGELEEIQAAKPGRCKRVRGRSIPRGVPAGCNFREKPPGEARRPKIPGPSATDGTVDPLLPAAPPRVPPLLDPAPARHTPKVPPLAFVGDPRDYDLPSNSIQKLAGYVKSTTNARAETENIAKNRQRTL
jgi:hypothetical protein